MDTLAVYLWLVGLVAGMPPEPVCKLAYEAASRVECERRAEWECAGSWACRQRWEAADREKRVIWCAWYAVWTQCDLDERIVWAARCWAVGQGDERFGQ